MLVLDRTTEAIAHFIGVFHLKVDAARMRESYDAFKAKAEKPEAPVETISAPVSLSAPLALPEFDPGVKHEDAPDAPEALQTPPFPPSHFELPEITSAAVPLQALDVEIKLTFSSPAPSPILVSPEWPIPIPTETMTVTVQTITLSDDDLLVFGGDHAFADPAIFKAQLAQLQEVAEALTLEAFEPLLEIGGMLSVDDLVAAVEEIAASEAAETQPEGVIHRDEDAAQVVVNGAVTDDELPDFKENMPQSLRKDDAEEGAEEEKSPFPDGFSKEPDMLPPGHHISTGENLAVNEVVLNTNWIDAKLILVGGDVAQYDLISQVNVLMDKDFGFEASDGAASKAVNAAVIRTEEAEETAEAAADEAPALPAFWHVEVVDGDLITSNWIDQHIFATDNDRAEIQLSGAKTEIGLGENVLANFTSVGHFGFNYDMIVVGGDFLTTNVVEQVNVLIDNDIVTGDIDLVDRIDSAENYLQNSASITKTGVDTLEELAGSYRSVFDAATAGEEVPSAVQSEPLFAGDEQVSVLYVTGDLIEQNTIRQHNYIGDSDQVDLALEDFMTTKIASLEAGLVRLEEEGAEQLSEGVAELDERLEEMRDSLSEVTVTTGSNALLNNVSINDMGIDSKIMAAGARYSDALIHQAELIDDAMAAIPTGVAMSGLTNEAIAAFVAEGMIAAAPDVELEGELPPMLASAGDLDVMGGVLT